MNGAHRANANMGIYSPKPSPPEINGHGVAVFFISYPLILSPGIHTYANIYIRLIELGC